MQLSVRDVDEEAFKEFKAAAVKNGMKLGGALNLAMEIFKDKLERKRKFTELKPIKGGKGTERVSEEVDKILYGD